MTINFGYKDSVYYQNNPAKWIEEVLIPAINGAGGTGIEPSSLSTNLQYRTVQIDIFSSRIILSNDFADETVVNTGGSEKASGGIVALDGAIFELKRVNGATDKAARIALKLNTTGELQFPPFYLPDDLDDTADMYVKLYAGMGGATDTPTIDVQCFFNVGDTECGAATTALAATAAEKTVTIAAADVPAAPGVLNIALVPAAHANDAIWIYGAAIKYKIKA